MWWLEFDFFVLCISRSVSDLELSQETYVTAHLKSNVLSRVTAGDVE